MLKNKTSLLPMTSHAVNLIWFHWDPTTKTLTAEDSDLGQMGGPKGGWVQPVWNDSADVGIAIRSHKTGKVERFYLDRVDMTPDGEDVAGWNFLPVDSDCPVKLVLVIND
jgi:hypothetical protein